jgi:hypothetical protein
VLVLKCEGFQIPFVKEAEIVTREETSWNKTLVKNKHIVISDPIDSVVKSGKQPHFTLTSLKSIVGSDTKKQGYRT